MLLGLVTLAACGSGSSSAAAEGCWVQVSSPDLRFPNGVAVSPDASEKWVVDQSGLIFHERGGQWFEPGVCPGETETWWQVEIPFGVAIRDDGIAAVSSAVDGTIWLVSPQDGLVATLPLDPAGERARTPTPHDVEWNNETLWVADVANSHVLSVSPDGSVRVEAGRDSVFDVGPQPRTGLVPAASDIAFPSGIDVLGDEVVIAEMDAGRLALLADGTLRTLNLTEFEAIGNCLRDRLDENVPIEKPSAVETTNDGKALVVADSRIGSILLIGVEESSIREVAGPCMGGEIFGVQDLDVDSAGNVYIVGPEPGHLLRITPDGTRTTVG